MVQLLPLAVNTIALLSIVLLTQFVSNLNSLMVNVKYERFQQNNGTDLIDASNLRIRKYNRTVTVFDGMFELFYDADNNYTFTVSLSYSPLGNNQFILSPFRIPMQQVCTFLNTTWRDYREFYRNVTNFPDVGTCPLLAQQYYIKNKILESRIIQNYLQSGLWKVDIYAFREDAEYPVLNAELLFQASREDIF